MFATDNFAFFNGIGLHGAGQYQFEKPLMYGVVFGLFALMLASIRMIGKGAIEQKHIIAGVGLCIPLLHYISSLNAVSSYLAKSSLYFQIGIYGFFVMGILIANNKKLLDYIMYVYLFIGSCITIYGFAYLIGNRYKTDALSFVEGVRLASIFTYANANAAFILTLILINLHYIVQVRRWVVAAILGASLVMINIAFLATLSRGAMLALPVILLCTLLISSLRKQVLMIIYVVLSGIIAMLIQSRLMSIGDSTFASNQESLKAGTPVITREIFSSESISAWLLIIGSALLMGLCTVCVQKYLLPRVDGLLLKWHSRRRSTLFIPGVFVLIAAIGSILLTTGILNNVIPETLARRIADINLNTHSVLERLTIYSDALRLWKDYIVFGAGGGAWEALYEAYQSYPYTSSQTHSYPIQILTETGIFGLIAIGGLIIYVLIRYIFIYVRERKSDRDASMLFMLIALSILVHSMIDFEMSYFFFSAIVFLSLGVIAGDTSAPIHKLEKMSGQLWIRRGISMAWIVIAVAVLIHIGDLMASNNKFKQSQEQLESRIQLNEIIKTLEDGLKRVPNHPFLLERAGVLYYSAFSQTGDLNYRTRAMAYFDKLKEEEPRMRSLNGIYYTDAKNVKNYDEAAVLMEAAIDNGPYEVSYYESAITSRYELFKQAYDNGDSAQQKKEKDRILKLYDEVEDRRVNLTRLNKNIIINKPIYRTKQIELVISKIQYYEGNYEQVASTLKGILTDEMSTGIEQEIARYYLASLRMDGKDDMQVYKALIKANADESERIEQLTTKR